MGSPQTNFNHEGPHYATSLMTVSCVDWVDICTDDSGNKCCGGDYDGMGDEASRHLYWIMRNEGTWNEQDIQCRMERNDARLAVFETKRENDCITRYLLDEYDASSADQYAIGLRVGVPYGGLYEWMIA